MKKTRLYISILLFIIIPKTSFGLIEVDITGGNLNPLPIAVSPLFVESNSVKEFQNLLHLNKEHKGKIGKEQQQALLFAKQKLDSARWFINAIHQRQKTLILTMSSIIKKQKNYFIRYNYRNISSKI